MAEFINTVDLLGDEVVANSFIDRSITEFRDDTVTKVKGNCFFNCKSLKLVDLPSITEIPSYTFYGCGNLTTVILRSNTVVQLGDINAFTSWSKLYAYVPKALIEDYKVANYWSTYASRLRAIEDYPEVCG